MTEETPFEPPTFANAPLKTTLWGVYGPDSFPTMFCCQFSEIAGYRAIWGYSVYRQVPGFRTLGTGAQWAEDNNLRLYWTQADAIGEMVRLTLPHSDLVRATPYVPQ